jgi:hypothetical protein
MPEQNTVREQIIAKAMKDEAFRQQLLSNPKVTLERELGIGLPADVNVEVHEDTATTLHLVLPMKAQESPMHELSDSDLEAAVGGVGMVYCGPEKTEGHIQ